jgi:glucosylceramidase
MSSSLRYVRALTAVCLLAAAVLACQPAAAGAHARARTHPPHRAHRTAQPPLKASVYETTYGLRRALTSLGPRNFKRAPAPGATVLAVNPAVRYQRMSGFGAAMTDSSAWLLNDELPVPARARAMDALFGADGIHLDFVRIPMAASDFSATGVPYTYDDMPAGQSDPSLAHFSIAHDEAYILPLLRQMLRIEPRVQTLANPWTAPPWMKANDSYNNVNWAGAILPADYSALAQYFVKFIQDYQQQGVPIDAVTPMNEPRSGSPWPGTTFLPAQEAQWISQNLVPALNAAGLNPQIFGLDDTELADAETLLSSPAATNLAGVAFHCYGGMGAMSTLHAQYPGTNIILSECAPGIIPYAPAEVGIDAARNWAGAIELWNLALDPAGGPVQSPNYGCQGCTGLVTVSETSHMASFNRDYYELGQLSKFVLPGAVRVASPRVVHDFAGPTGYGVSTGLDDVAFVNPSGQKVLVAYNNSPRTLSFAVEDHHRYVSWALPPAATITLSWP